LRSILPDPWERAEREFPIGMTMTGVVARLTKFGAFVTLSPGVDGLVHISRIGRGKRISHPSEVLKEGQALEVRVEKIDREAKRISLVPADELVESAGDDKKEEPDDFRKYMVKDSVGFGSFGELLKKKLGAKKGA